MQMDVIPSSIKNPLSPIEQSLSVKVIQKTVALLGYPAPAETRIYYTPNKNNVKEL